MLTKKVIVNCQLLIVNYWNNLCLKSSVQFSYFEFQTVAGAFRTVIVFGLQVGNPGEDFAVLAI